MDRSEDKTTSQSFAKSSGVAIVAIIFSSLLRLIMLAVLSRILVPEAYGHYVIGYGLIMILSNTAKWGMPNAMLRWGAIEFSENRLDSLKALMYFGLITMLVATLIIGAISFIFAKQIIGFIGNSISIYEFKLFLISVPLIVVVELFAAIARSSKSVSWFFLLKEIIPCIILLLLILIISNSKMTTGSVVVCFIISYLSTLLIGWRYLKQSFFTGISTKWLAIKYSKKSLLTFGASIAILGFLSLTKDRAIIFLVANYATAADAGVLFNASRLAMMMTIILSGINTILAPQIAILHETGSIDEMQLLYQRVVKWTVFIITPVVIISLLEADLVMWVIFGSEYGLAGQLFGLCALFRFFNLISGPTGIVIQMTGIERLDVYTNALHLTLITTTLVIVLPRYGLYWGVIASGFTGLLIDTVRVWIIKMKIGILPISLKGLLTLSSIFILLLIANNIINVFISSKEIHFLSSLTLASLGIAISWKALLNNEDKIYLILLIRSLTKLSMRK